MPTLPPTHKPSRIERKAWEGSGKGRGGRPWRRLREQILRRDNFLCVTCAKGGRYTVATEVDHIQEIAGGGTNDPNNLQSICSDCHKAKTAKRKGCGV